MAYIKFNKKELVNLNYSLNREFIRVNKLGAYGSTTIIFCNTRKYHGLLNCPCENLDGGIHVLLSSLDETVIQRERSFNLAIHKYPGEYSPKGHKYIEELGTEPIFYHIYRVGGVVLKKEILLNTNANQVMIRYTLLDAHSPTKLQFRPFLAFRNIHSLSKANLYADTSYTKVPNGIKIRLYQGYPYLFMQFSKKVEYVHYPLWYYNVEYKEEYLRGYDHREDLMVPGYFEVPIKKGENIVFSASTQQQKTRSLKVLFEKELESRLPLSSYENCLKDAANQFVVKAGNKYRINAGYHWFANTWGRDTFISLPGLLLPEKNFNKYYSVLDHMTERMNGPLFANTETGDNASFNSADASLWFIWAVQQLAIAQRTTKHVWNRYKNKIKKVINGYIKGTEFNIKMHDNGLIWQGKYGLALTWMDAIVDGKPVTPRTGYAVEINALWYNALMFVAEAAKKNNDEAFYNKIKDLPGKVKSSFKSIFWNKSKGYLADYHNGDKADWSIRPNQIIAASIPYSPIEDDIKLEVLNLVEKELLTPRGLRTLSPRHPDYKPKYEGDQRQRDAAYHQGTVWVWLLGHFAEAYLRIHGKSGVFFIEKLYKGFEPELQHAGIGTINEIFDGDPPHAPRGAISQAWSIAELRRMKKLINYYKHLKTT